MKHSAFSFIAFLFSFIIVHEGKAQLDTIPLINPSFEDVPRAGGTSLVVGIRNWFDCGRINFPSETPPDIHPVMEAGGGWENTLPPSHGRTYLGMVARDNDSYESVSQRLIKPLEKDKCYRFSIEMVRSSRYYSRTRKDENKFDNYVTPLVLNIYGGTGYCNTVELLGTSSPVGNSEWKTFEFEFRPQGSYRYITLEANYKTPTLIPYNGHILIDNASAIEEIYCPGEEPVIASVEVIVPEKKVPPHKQKKNKPKPVAKEKEAEPAPVKKKKILAELDRANLREGQVIEIKNLYFKADTSSINKRSHDVLDEVYDFLRENKDVIVEIGGHTNGVPPHKYCDQLSNDRAKAVASYLVRKGIEPVRLKHRGYGKRKPIASNRTKEGRKKNQRVEIKILGFNS